MENNIEVMKKSDSESGVDNKALHATIDKFRGLASGTHVPDMDTAVYDTIVALNVAVDACSLSPKAIIAAGKMYDEMLRSENDAFTLSCMLAATCCDPHDGSIVVTPEGVAQAYKDFLDKRASFVGLEKSLKVRKYVY